MPLVNFTNGPLELTDEEFALLNARRDIQRLINDGHLISHGGFPTRRDPQTFSLSDAMQSLLGDGSQIAPAEDSVVMKAHRAKKRSAA